MLSWVGIDQLMKMSENSRAMDKKPLVNNTLAGIANQSISIDGMSQSIGTTQSAKSSQIIVYYNIQIIVLFNQIMVCVYRPKRNQQVSLGY